jgi:UDP:flavonoid glycosyltransferase YjiC (YdhE family)
MRVLMTTTGYAGHMLPLVPFARACERAGHEVLVAGPRSQSSLAARAGLEYCGCAEPAPEQAGRIVASAAQLAPAEGHALMMAEGFARTATRALLPDLLRLVEASRPNLLVHESQEFAAALAAELHRIPHARVGLGLAAAEDELLSLAAGPLDVLRAELGLPADPHAQRLRSSPYLTLTPAALELPDAPEQPRTRRFRASAPPPRERPDDADAPLVYVTFGSVAGSLGFFPGLYRAAIEALSGIDARLLVTIGELGDPAALGPLPRGVRVARWVDQGSVAARAAAIVCHGGYGSTLGALAHGVPLVILPLFGGDQWINARRVADLGAGIALEREPGPGRRMFDQPPHSVIVELRDAVETVLADPSYARAAGDIARAVAALPAVDAYAAAIYRDAAAASCAR